MRRRWNTPPQTSTSRIKGLLVLASINLFTIESCRLRYSRIYPAGRVVGLSLRCAKAEKTVSRCAQHMSRELTRMVSLLRVFLSTMTRHGYTRSEERRVGKEGRSE